MTCASCAARVEKRLNRVDGVIATVNFATEQATVDFPDYVTPQDLVAAVEETGYTATLPEASAESEGHRRHRGATTAGVGDADRSRGSAVDDSGAAVRLLAVGGPGARFPGRGVGRVALPPRRAGQPAPPRGDDGHTDLGRGGRGLPVVGVGAVLHPRGHAGHEDDGRPAGEWRCRTSPLSRGRRRGHHLHPRRSLFRGARQAAVRRCASRPPRHGREGRLRPARRVDRNAHSHRTTRGRATSSWRVLARRSPPTVSWCRARRRWTRRC